MYVVIVKMKKTIRLNFVLNAEQSMKQVVDVEDLFWLVEKYKKYYKEHNGKRYFDPAGLHYAIQKLIIMKGYFIDD
jgi:hypothetical protein